MKKIDLEIFINTQVVVNKNYLEPIKEIVTCIICKGIILEPRQCESCENYFCKKCLNKWISNSNVCPLKCINSKFKDGGRTIKGLLEKLILKCPYDCGLQDEMNYDILLKHISICERMKIHCPTCKSFVALSEIDLNEIEALREKVISIEKENLKVNKEKNDLIEENKKLKEKITELQSIYNDNMAISKSGIGKESEEICLIDKCEHYKGNYKPIFSCCDKAYFCCDCHDKVQTHVHVFSNKVVCLICCNIYSGARCTQCHAIQVFKKK